MEMKTKQSKSSKRINRFVKSLVFLVDRKLISYTN